MRGLAILLACALAAGPALAGTAVTLRSDPTDADGLVTLGDVFDGAGAAAKTPLVQRTGMNVTMDALAVQSAARRAGLDWPNAEGIRRIAVRAAAGGGQGQGPGQSAKGNIEVLTYARSLTTGETVQPQDLVWAKAAAAPVDAPSDAEQVIGQAAKRPLRAGQAVSSRDVAAAMVIKAGEIVTIAYDDGAVSLSLQGRALANAGVGESLNVQNVTSKKIVQAVAIGPGQAVVGPAADRMRLTRPARLASR